MSKFECPLDIFAYYLKYPPEFVSWLKSRGYRGPDDAVKNWPKFKNLVSR